ncbi:tRNA adenosine(34) deaminase TadA [Thermodesulfobacteriota bacterium]
MLTVKNRNDKNFEIMDTSYDLLMEQALLEAKKGLEMGEVPIGAVLVDHKGGIVAKAYNQPIALSDPTAHAEILVLRAAGGHYENYRLKDTTLVVTIEPCIMCMGAALNARISRLVFGAFDPKSGASGSLYKLAEDSRLNHCIEVVSGVMAKDCVNLLQEFFILRRSERRS